MAIQIGKYKRPGIFLEEFDKSVIATPIVEGINNMVIGVSKKGPINTPIRLTTVNDLESIFGSLDRGLERKGSFFHRTVSKMLESSPVYAMNLLLTDDTLDVIEYKSLSGSADYINDIEREGPYRRFHDTTGFWKRDSESFINLTKSNIGYEDRVFSITNLSDRYTTVFAFKTARTGFDRTLIEWYGSAEKVPPYVSTSDWASDYMLDIVVVAGDWSNYQELAVDVRWSAYFNAEGLRKEQVRNFANDRNVTLLAYYEGVSLIPYFRDANGTNIFIETIINRDTDKTGIFCAFNNDLVEADYFNGKLDLIGHTIAGKNETNIDFLSYTETIAEEVEINGTPLDLPGNVVALLGTYSFNKDHAFGVGLLGDSVPATGFVENGNRTAYFAEGYVSGVKMIATASVTTSKITAPFSADTNAYAIIGGNHILLTGATLSISAGDYASQSTVATYSSAFVLDSTGTFKVVNGSTSDYPTIATTDIVLGYASFGIAAGEFLGGANFEEEQVTIGIDYFKSLTFGTGSNDYYVEEVNAGEGNQVKITFNDTASTPSTSNYKQYRRIKMFSALVDLIDNPNKDKAAMLVNLTSMEKASLSGMSISNIVTSTSQNKSFVLNTGLSSAELSDILKGVLVFYTIDNEFVLGTHLVTEKTSTAAGATGSVGKYSKFYTRFFDGAINTGDFFYKNLAGTSSYNVTFVPGETSQSVSGYNTGATAAFAGNDYIVFSDDLGTMLEQGDVIYVKGSSLNTGSFTIVSNLVTGFGNTGTEKVYRVSENTTYEYVTGVTQVYDNNLKHYLKMYLDSNDNLTAEFLDESLTSAEPVEADGKYSTFFIQSADSNYKQSIEIELPTGYAETPNKILVNGSRYTEVKAGDFLEAYYDESLLAIGEYPRKLTRIISKKQYAGDTSLVEITCDSRIKKSYSGAAYQSTRYKSVDNYATTYKAISLKGFRIREASLPDGTETRQNSILNIVAKGTPLFKALTNKEAIEFRYLVDTFGLGLTERSKQQLVDICGERLDVFGFINAPSMRSFKNSSSPSFVDADGVLQLEYVAAGGNPDTSPAFLYSFGDGAGSTSVGYFMPYLTVNDNGRPLEMPPASYVATTYMRKHNSGLAGITPWTIAAGVTNGRITNISGLEMDFTQSDIEYLNQAQFNPIVFKRNRGNVIETENTAQTLYKSALSFIHVREVLIELEKELSRMLLDYQWQFNTQDVRSEIKYRADVICEGFVNQSGLYNYFNKMDDENNTPEIIDNQIGVLDTYVEPIKGMGIIVNNVTILRTGAIDAGGFQ